MRISVFGLGYVGVVSAACLSHHRHWIIGVDVNATKVDMLNQGIPPVVEQGLDDLVAAAVRKGSLKATTDPFEAIKATDVSLVCVGTPSRPDGGVDTTYVFRVAEEIGRGIREKSAEHTVVLRSTVLPGTTETFARVIQNEARGIPVHVAFNPEFLREGSSLSDFYSPPYTIIGTDSPEAERMVREIYSCVDAPVLVVEIRVAEMVKYVANAWHATKIAFANEIGRLAREAGVDGREVMDIIIKDTKLNVSPAYMRPGFAYGGSCLPKDLRALLQWSRIRGLELPLLAALPVSNQIHIESTVRKVLETGRRKVGLLGLAFKPGTDDLRESPSVELAERLLGKGCELRILDPMVHTAKLMGSNREYIEQKIPHLSCLLVESEEEILQHAQVLVITHNTTLFRSVVEKAGPDVIVVDAAGALPFPKQRLDTHVIAS